MTAPIAKLADNLSFLVEPLRSTKGPNGQEQKRRAAVTESVNRDKSASCVVALPVPSASVARHVDWYVEKRHLPTQIADFLDTHWRSYLLQCLLKGGEGNERFRSAVKTMKDLAWSVRPKKEPLSRRRLVALIPHLYEQLHLGLESLGLGSGASEHDAFFGELARLHQTALNP